MLMEIIRDDIYVLVMSDQQCREQLMKLDKLDKEEKRKGAGGWLGQISGIRGFRGPAQALAALACLCQSTWQRRKSIFVPEY